MDGTHAVTMSEASAGATGGGASSRSGRRIVVLAACGLLALLVAAGVAAYVTGALDAMIGGGDAAYDAPERTQESPPKVFYDLPDFIVNLNGGGRKARFLKLRSRLELNDPADVARVQAAMPRIVDAFQVYLRELRPEDLSGSAGTHRLREALTRRVGAEIGQERVSAVLFVDLLVQ